MGNIYDFDSLVINDFHNNVDYEISVQEEDSIKGKLLYIRDDVEKLFKFLTIEIFEKFYLENNLK